MTEQWLASPPSRWADAERDFHLAYLADPAGPYPRQQVTVAWITRTYADLGRIPLRSRLGRAWRGDTAPTIGTEITVTTDGQGPSMTFHVDPELRPASIEGSGTGTAVGGIGGNAVTCVEIGDVVLWPVFNPVGHQARL